MYFAEKIGIKRSRTPEGFLLIEATPVARIGTQLYAPEELGYKIPAGPDGLIRIQRLPDEVFDPVSMASLNGKPFVNEHPQNLIGPANWRHLALGVVMNPRRGTGDERDFIVADVLIQDQAAIDLVETGKCEVSCGYNAEYEFKDDEPGVGYQRGIRYNHLALVSAGRCGPSCAIGDHAVKEKDMAKITLGAHLMKLFGLNTKDELLKTLDAEVMGAAADPVANKEVHIHLGAGGGGDADPPDQMEELRGQMKGLSDTVSGIAEWVKGQQAKDAEAEKAKAEEEAAAAAAAEKEKKTEDNGEVAGEETKAEMAEETGEEWNDEKLKATKDSAPLAVVWQRTVAMAEIIAPGIPLPTLDAAKPLTVSLKAICDHRRNALKLASLSGAGRTIISDLHGGRLPDFDKLTCDGVRKAFLAAGVAMKRHNNSGAASHDHRPAVGGGGIRSIADLAALAEKQYPSASAQRLAQLGTRR